MPRCLVTGGAGFIGSNLVDRLVADGHEVRVLDCLATGRRENLAHLGGRIALLEGDIRDREALARAMEGVERVFHQAAIPSVPWSVDHPDLDHDVNARGTLEVLRAAHAAGARRVVFASSCSVYGDDAELPNREDARPDPASPYAVSKLTSEHLCRLWTKAYGLETVALRYFNVYGPRQQATSQYGSVVPCFITRMLAGRPPIVYGDGLQTRDFVYVGDVVDANLRAMDARGVAGRVFNVGSGERTSVVDLATALRDALGRPVDPEFAEARSGDVRDAVASLDAARAGLGYAPHVGLREGLRRTAAWLEEHAGEAAPFAPRL